MRKLILVPVLCGLLMTLPAKEAPAEESFIASWRAYYPEACATLYQRAQTCVLCHTSGFGLNEYGADLANNGVNYAVVGLLDSDGDGRTNNQEINLDCTDPADDTAPGETFTWSSVKALFD